MFLLTEPRDRFLPAVILILRSLWSARSSALAIFEVVGNPALFFNISESAQETRALGGLGGQKDGNFCPLLYPERSFSIFWPGHSSPGEKKGRDGGGGGVVKIKVLEFADINT